MMNKYEVSGVRPALEKARKDDAGIIAELYKSAIGRFGCTWNEYYPTREDAEYDISNDCLYKITLDGNFIGCVSIVPENELDGLDLWKSDGANPREIARLVIKEEYSGNGYAASALSALFEIMKNDGVTAVRLLAAKDNISAVRTYEKLGFDFCGECYMYENNYYACELEMCFRK